jgi:biopolymer transport protein ExbB
MQTQAGARIAVRAVLTLLISLVLTGPAAAWWKTDWNYRKAITVDTSPSGANMSGAIGRTVLLVRLHSGNFTFTDALENGADVRIVDTDDKTPLPFHIERWDAKTGIALIWVSVPNLNGGEKKQLWLYFNNKTAPVGDDVKGTFDPDYLLAYHFSENPGQPASDKTANANNSQNPPAGVDDSGIIARAARFPGQGELIVPPSASLAMPAAAPLTVSAWVKPDQLAGQQSLFSRGDLMLGLNNGVPFFSVGGASVQASAPLKQGDWSLVALVADGKTIKIYVNGVEAGAASAALPALDGPILLGGGNGRPFTGELDEVRVSKTARPPAMLMAMAQAEGSSGKLVSVAETAEKQSSGGGTFFFILGKVEAVDAVIIGICMIMLIGAITVIVRKAQYVGLARRANAAFMRRFRQMHEELISIEEMPGIDRKEVAFIKKGPLSRIFETGMEEVDIRRKVWGDRPLSSEAVEAMRAAIDAVVVEENQKLDRFMVLLTIAISGGPFIGLLGTVMGVMNTFGGVAIAGDVNVNAIAPGIAAALLATIAGLSCAIPSLFGYNYLNTQIAAIGDELRVFVDRLVTRLAEMQADNANPPPLRVAAE